MRYMRCKCGKKTGWTSDGAFAACAGCTDCGTTLADHPDFHKPTAEHVWEVRYDTHTGQPSHRTCEVCHTRSTLADANEGAGTTKAGGA